MTKIIYKTNSIELKGHTNFRPKGNDIVCAGISAIIFGGISWFNKKDIYIENDEKNAYLKLNLLKKTKQNKNKLYLLIKQLSQIEKKYKKYVKIKKG